MNREKIFNFLDGFFSVYASLAHLERGIRILMYHLISQRDEPREKILLTVSLSRFQEQLEIIRTSSYQVISLSRAFSLLQKGEVNQPYLVLTFDDFFSDTVENALPLLLKFKFPACFFVVTNYLDSPQKFPWLSHPERYPPSGSKTMVRELAELGFEIGSHTCSHPHLGRLTPEQVKTELVNSKQVLEDIIGRAVDFLAYPFGAPNDVPSWVQKIVKESGYLLGLGTLTGINRHQKNLYYLRRTGISKYDQGDKFLRKLKGANDWYLLWQKTRSFFESRGLSQKNF